jgi:GTP-binding protein HflX
MTVIRYDGTFFSWASSRRRITQHCAAREIAGAGLTTKTDRIISLKDEQRPERAFLIAVEIPRAESLWDTHDSLDELAALARTAGAEVVGNAVQRLSRPNSALYVGRGRAHELAALRAELDLDLLIVDDELSPTQQRNLEELTDLRVIDRTALILDIFAQHARTREGQLQVELAQLEYRLPRLTGRGKDLSRVGGGSRGSGGVGGAIGVRGPGETKLEIDRRRIRSRIAEVRRSLEGVRQQRAQQRRQRAAQAIPTVAIVGYTNAGKSTLFNALTSARVTAENKLFATLDPTTRQVALPGGQQILLSDTVGFIQKLPTMLVAAFRATLEEVVEADALLEVVDITHENAVEQSQTVNEVLEELGASDKPRITALNKIDLLADPASVDTAIYPNAVAVSAVTGQGLEALLAKIGEVLTEDMLYLRALVPYSRGDLLEQWRRRGRVPRQNEIEEGTRVEGLAPRAVAAFLAPYRLPDEPARRSRFVRSYADDDESGESSGESAGVDGAKVRLD